MILPGVPFGYLPGILSENPAGGYLAPRSSFWTYLWESSRSFFFILRIPPEYSSRKSLWNSSRNVIWSLSRGIPTGIYPVWISCKIVLGNNHRFLLGFLQKLLLEICQEFLVGIFQEFHIGEKPPKILLKVLNFLEEPATEIPEGISRWNFRRDPWRNPYKKFLEESPRGNFGGVLIKNLGKSSLRIDAL